MIHTPAAHGSRPGQPAALRGELSRNPGHRRAEHRHPHDHPTRRAVARALTVVAGRLDPHAVQDAGRN
ncbi:MAG: hypothetical protein JJT89_14605 [Nitriliruptoraceae bacterium]|nr:hypothetical protein [Nitriliruptoraceae bacterium]